MSATHKRKRSLENIAVDVAKVRRFTSSLHALKEELLGIDETEAEMAEVMKHVDELERILKESKRTKITFSSATHLELANLGVKTGRLIFHKATIKSLGGQVPESVEDELKDLCGRLVKIYRRVNMNFEVGARMVLDAILLSVGEITTILKPQKDVAIIPEMKLEDAPFSKDGYQVVLGGSIDYGIVEYMVDEDDDTRGRLVGPGLPNYIFEVASGHIFLVEAKQQQAIGGLMAFIPQAVTQAMATSKNGNLETVRFCLSDGHYFIFFVLRRNHDEFTYYESNSLRLYFPDSTQFDEKVREITFLLLEWLKAEPTKDLYELVPPVVLENS
ncbi:hypothetical protein HGRIS_010493 [Hohenbuehelia grisea]|uniref:Uncharacterized protein n=1 Tax=Hohenbuehelia grisea TaxID=104357 RepID=A0ABR3IX40_9AGAR